MANQPITSGKYNGKTIRQAIADGRYLDYLKINAPQHWIYYTYLQLKSLMELRDEEIFLENAPMF